MEVIGSLAKKHTIRIAQEDLSEEQIVWSKEFGDRSDIISIHPGKRDHIYIGKFERKSQNIQKQYLLWKRRDVLDIVNGYEIAAFQNDSRSFQDRAEKKLSFSKLYNFLKSHKQCVWNRDIPGSLCLCEVLSKCLPDCQGDLQAIKTKAFNQFAQSGRKIFL